MENKSVSLIDIKKLRLERHWSQAQLAELSGLSIRTIQRIEKGENADFETLKSLAAVFEVNLTREKQNDEDQEFDKIKKEYVKEVKGIYKLIAIAVICMLPLIIMSVLDMIEWNLLGWIALSWVVIIIVNLMNSFEFFGKKWEKKITDKKFNNKK